MAAIGSPFLYSQMARATFAGVIPVPLMATLYTHSIPIAIAFGKLSSDINVKRLTLIYNVVMRYDYLNDTWRNMMTDNMKTARFVKKCDWGTGDARLYELSEPVEYDKPWDDDDPPAKKTKFVAVSAT